MRTPMLLTVVAALSLNAGCATLSAAVERAAERIATRDTPRPDGARAVRLPDEPPPPLFGDWWYNYFESMRSTRKPESGDPCLAVPRFDYRNPATYVPVNVPGGAHGGPSYIAGTWYSWYARCMADELDRVGAPMAVLIRERNCPFPYATKGHATSPSEVQVMLDTVPKLDYLIMDLEPIGGGTPDDVRRNAAEIVRLVRSHPNPRVNRAFIGNYDDHANPTNLAGIWPDKRDRTRATAWNWDRPRFYREHFNISMPVAYPYEVYSRHTSESVQRGDVAPNNRAAIFWAPLERVSGAARVLPDGHLLIPWVSNYVEYDEDSDAYNAPPPPADDLEAIIQHLRLRGAYSYMVWTANPQQTDHPTIDHVAYRDLAMRAWRTLDPLFDTTSAEPPVVLNLETDKASGVQWSGMALGDRAWIIVSNLGTDAVQLPLPDLPGLPEATPSIPPGAHRIYRYRLDG